jgi:tRNA threonylcarbamoyladenosine biosynthesis protein TsaB
MQILAIDTTGDACSCALLREGRVLQESALAPRAHTRHLLPMVKGLLEGEGLTLKALDGVAFGAGPGSFTGVRIATAMAQGLAMAAGIPAVPVSSLAALALAARERHGAERVIACADARMGEVYFGSFIHDHTGTRAQGEEQVGAAADLVLPPDGEWSGAGSGFEVHGPALARLLGHRLRESHPQVVAGAAQVARLAAHGLARGEGVPATRAVPSYLRDNVARTRSERDHAASKDHQ